MAEQRKAMRMLGGATALAPLLPFVDLHVHALPGVDNGPVSWSAAVELCVQAAHNGISHAVLTPHFRGKPYAERIVRLSTRLIRLREALVDRGLTMEVALAGECRFDAALHQAIQTGDLPWLGRWQDDYVVLIEFSDARLPAKIVPAIEWMRTRGIRPMLAHPERIREVQSRPQCLAPLVAAGLLLQVDADALAGGCGPFAQETSLRLLREGWVTILASNAHDLVRQPPRIEPGRVVAAEILGDAVSWELVALRPARIAAMHFPALAPN
ncbi:MAG: capsular biosynthesis protein [Xanthomonadales bacterium]|nr:capsular biosynthesis protein [Xanthomonadales bacterium]MBK7145282.1 capsular biosynthesis protein [Xanthomonadales bacterium]MCC6561027.1 capsular biosynthesis protein [Xanthomonadales bacterium]